MNCLRNDSNGQSSTLSNFNISEASRAILFLPVISLLCGKAAECLRVDFVKTVVSMATERCR